jgi:hypothetical protein
VNGYVDALRDELVAAAVRQHRGRHRRRAIVSAGAGVVVVAGIVALLVGVLVDPDDDSASADQAIRATRAEESVYLEILSFDHPEDVLADLRAAGIDASSQEHATGPSRVGKIVALAVDGESDQPVNAQGAEFAAYLLPTAKVVVGIGVPAPAGGLYDMPTDAFEVGEPLRCRSWPGQSTADLAIVADEADLNLRVVDPETGPLESLPPDRVVTAATAIAADRVIVSVAAGEVAGPPVYCATAALGG